MNLNEIVSQRLLRKGALVEETYLLFQGWDAKQSLDANLEKVLQGRFQTLAWGSEVTATLRRRFRDIDDALPLITTAQSGLPLEEWRSCLLLWIGSREVLYRDFALKWLYPEFVEGRYQLRVPDVLPFVQKLCSSFPEGRIWSDYGLVRTARDLLRMASDFHLLCGKGPSKTFSSPRLSDRCLLYFAHRIAEVEGSTSKVPSSKLWNLALMRPLDVDHELLRLHQFQKLEYHVAGSLVQLSLPCASSREYAERMVA